MKNRERPKALQGINVVDFSWVAAGPLHTKCLADFGATVIRIETSLHPEVLRHAHPFKDGIPGIDRSGYFANYNTNKYDISLNLRHPKGIEIARKLVSRADIVAENFVPGVMERWGLGYDDLRKIKSDIIMFSCSQLGSDGPHSKQRGYGSHLTSFTGISSITGWPDRDPTPPYGSHTDFVAPRYGIPAIMAALLYRKRTGSGQWIDMSQLEVGLTFLGPLCLDYTVNDRLMERRGNSSPYAVPRGAYRCRGEERWCAIEVSSEAEWEAFCQTLGQPQWCREKEFAVALRRKENEEELNKHIEAWTINFTAEKVMTRLQMSGVAAGVVKTAKDVLEDPQLGYYHYFWWLEHQVLGLFPYLGQPMSLSKTPAEGYLPSPCLGEHTEYVCREILEMSDEEFIGYLNDGVFT